MFVDNAKIIGRERISKKVLQGGDYTKKFEDHCFTVYGDTW